MGRGGRRSSPTGEGAGFVEVLSPPLTPVPAVLPARPPHGARAPLQDDAAEWVDAGAAIAPHPGASSSSTTPARARAEMAGRPWREWLRTYRSHGRGEHYLAVPGEQDITADVALDQLPEPDAVRTQAQFLRRWGIDELAAEGRRSVDSRRGVPDLAAMTMRSRVREAEALLDPDGLGAFTVAEWIAPDPPTLRHAGRGACVRVVSTSGRSFVGAGRRSIGAATTHARE